MRAGFVVSEAFTGIRRNLTMTIAMVLTTAISLCLLGVGLVLSREASHTRDLYESKIAVIVQLTLPESSSDPNCTDPSCQALLKSLQSNPEVQDVDYNSQAQAYQQYQQQYANQPDMRAIARPQAFSAYFRVRLNNPSHYQVIATQYGGQPGVSQVNSQANVVTKLIDLVNSGRNLALFIALAAAIAAILLIANVVQVAALSRRAETNIMRLVGASRWRTQMPFMVEGAIGGLIGGVLAVVGLVLCKIFFLDKLIGTIVSSNVIYPVQTADIVWAGYVILPIGVVLSLIASYVTLRVYVRV